MAFNLDPGVHLQIYFDSIAGGNANAKIAALSAQLPAWKAAGIAGVIPHGFPSDLPPIYDSIAAAVTAAGLPCGVAMGLDMTTVSASQKGDALGSLAARPGCYVALVDCETHYDTSPTRVQEMTDLGAAFRARAPDVTCIAQPWPEPLVHPSFPYEQENDFVDANAYQAYYNAWRSSLGKDRYAKLEPLFRSQWDTLNRSRLETRPRQMMLTIEGYGWDDIPWDCVTCLLANTSVIVWCDAFPTDTFLKAVRSVNALATSGYVGQGAVTAFQTAAKASGAYAGAVDGQCGPETMAALGIA